MSELEGLNLSLAFLQCSLFCLSSHFVVPSTYHITNPANPYTSLLTYLCKLFYIYLEYLMSFFYKSENVFQSY